MPRKTPPGDDEVGMSEDEREAASGARAALSELAHAEDDARRAEQRREQQRLRQRTLFSRLLHARSAWLRQLAARLVGNRDADDTAHDTLAGLMTWLRRHSLAQGIALLESPPAVESLLLTIAARRAYVVLRLRQAVPIGSGRVEPAERAPELEELTAAYRALTPLQRIAHVLHDRYGLTDTELAAKLGIPRTRSRTLVCRAARALQRAMEIKS